MILFFLESEDSYHRAQPNVKSSTLVPVAWKLCKESFNRQFTRGTLGSAFKADAGDSDGQVLGKTGVQVQQTMHIL